MKYLSFVAMMTLSMSSFAEKKVEFDETQEKVCYAEAGKVGCVKSAGAAADKTCARSKKSKLPSKCYSILGIQ